MNESVRVVKIGGSLLDWDDLPRQLDRWLDLQQPARTLLIAGGGRWADAVRQESRRRPLDQRTAHWMCIDAMSITARLVADWMSDALLLDDVNEFVRPQGETPLAILDARSFLREVEPTLPGERLPESWDVTSDSIAARVARYVEAEELVLLKSTLPCGPAMCGSANPLAWAEVDYVDRFFPNVTRDLRRLRCVDLRSDGFDEVTATCEHKKTAAPQ
ncbi:MAG: hypothetical protein IID44_06775 [Planctomycetes bacterium]|nr:hypothetical protein [Planctomycetota bacterium]